MSKGALAVKTLECSVETRLVAKWFNHSLLTKYLTKQAYVTPKTWPIRVLSVPSSNINQSNFIFCSQLLRILRPMENGVQTKEKKGDWKLVGAIPRSYLHKLIA